MPVDGLKHAAQSMSALRGQSRVCSLWATLQNPQQLCECFDAIETAFVEWNNRSERIPGASSIDQQQPDRFGVVGDPQAQALPVMARGVLVDSRQGGGFLSRKRCFCGEDDRAGIDFRLPIDSRLQRILLRIDREIVAPRTGARSASVHGGPLS